MRRCTMKTGENHELRLAAPAMRRTAQAGTLEHSNVATSATFRKTTETFNMMIWETPAATDLRFGFEITMYIANR